MHLDKSSPNTDLTLLSANYTGSSTYMKLTVFPEHSLLANESTTMVTNQDTIYKYFFNEYHQVIGSCNGLCCLMQLSSNAEYREFSFRLCNPTTRSLSHKLASFRISLDHPDSLLKFSFGYDNLTRSYKVVAFRLTENGGLYLNNCLIWYGHCTSLFNPLEQFVIISLDLGTERCTEMMPPQGFDGEMREFGVQESWIKLFNINFQDILRSIFSYSRYDQLLRLHVLENGNTLILANGEGQRLTSPTLFANINVLPFSRTCNGNSQLYPKSEKGS
ncbi:uncharacterized protein LOC131597038 [Vicia villosa]|uniref:uncharacterized protein LOC131597038 n=1 Tax=Vicia villosa TaxID=3911 RepID=UPI00273B01E2|nr:uncharacterized protein LOC131597038 [Vicia villosa]